MYNGVIIFAEESILNFHRFNLIFNFNLIFRVREDKDIAFIIRDSQSGIILIAHNSNYSSQQKKNNNIHNIEI